MKEEENYRSTYQEENRESVGTGKLRPKGKTSNVVCRKRRKETARSKSVETSLMFSLAAEKRSGERSERDG